MPSTSGKTKRVVCPESRPECRHELFAVALVIATGGALRLYQLGTESLWNDEWLSLSDSRELSAINRHRPLYYLVLHIWVRFLRYFDVTTGDMVLRLPAVFFGCVGVLFLYLLARRLIGGAGSVCAAILMAIAVPEIDHSQEVRMYSMASALTLAGIYFLLRWEANRKLWLLVVHGVLSYLALLTTPLSGVVIAIVVATMLAYWLVQGRLKLIQGTICCYLILGLLWLPFSRYLGRAVNGLDWVPRPTRADPLLIHAELLTGGLGGVHGFRPNPSWQYLVVLVVLLLVACSVLIASAKRSQLRIVGVIWYGFVLGMFVISCWVIPLWSPRFFHLVAPALYLLVGFGIVALWRRSQVAGSIIGGILVVGSAGALVDYYRLPMRGQWRSAAVFLSGRTDCGDTIAVAGLPLLLKRYYDGPAALEMVWPNLKEMSEARGGAGVLTNGDRSVIAEFLQQVRPHRGRTWIVIREDPRFRRVDFINRLTGFLKERSRNVRIKIFPAVFPDVQGQIDIVEF